MFIRSVVYVYVYVTIRSYSVSVPRNDVKCEYFSQISLQNSAQKYAPICQQITMRQLMTGLILGLRSANERRRYCVTSSLIGWTQA